MVWFWALIVSSAILTTGGSYVLISGIIDLQSSPATLWGLLPWTRVILGALGIIAFFTLVLVAGARSKRRSSSWRIQSTRAGLS